MTDIPADVQIHVDAANLAESQGNHAGRAAAATAALNAWGAAMRPTPSAEPQDAVGASARLAHLQKDPAWRGKYFNGDQEARAEFGKLTGMVAAADPIDLVMNGVAPPDGVDENSGMTPSGRDLVAGAKHLSEIGFTTGEIREVLTGKLEDDTGPLTPAEIAAGAAGGQRWLDRATKDATFRKSLLEGDRSAREMFDRICAVVAAGKGTP